MVATVARYEVHCAAYPLSGVREAADVAIALADGHSMLAAIVDPAGQGRHVVDLGRRAADVVRRHAKEPLAEILTLVHRSIAESTGVSLALARLTVGSVEFGGVGRVYGAILGSGSAEPLVSCPGTIGVGLPRSPEVVKVPWRSGSVLILAADGLVDVWNLVGARGVARELAMPALVQRLSGYSTRLPEDASIVIIRDPR